MRAIHRTSSAADDARPCPVVAPQANFQCAFSTSIELELLQQHTFETLREFRFSIH